MSFSIPDQTAASVDVLSCARDIPRARREALPGIRTCIECQSKRDQQIRTAGINRRGSKDSQLR